MRIVLDRKQFSEALSDVGTIIPRSHPADVMKMALLSVAGGQAVLVGSDQAVSIRQELAECEADGDGEVLLNPKLLQPVLRETQSDYVALDVLDGRVEVKAGGSCFMLATADPKEYPQVDAAGDGPDRVDVEANVLRRMIDLTVFSCDVNSTRYALGGVMFSVAGGTLTLAATDSRRLSVSRGTCDIVGTPSLGHRPVVPAEGLALLRKVIPDRDRTIQLEFRDNEVTAKAGPATINCRLIDGRFPKYQDVIPAEFSHEVAFVVGSLHSVVRQSMIATDKESSGVDFLFRDGTLSLSSRSDGAQASIELPIGYSGEYIDVCLDPTFVADLLKRLDPAGQVYLRMTDGKSAVLFDVPEVQYVVMPMSSGA